jgi:hypothetical protein
MTARKSSQSGSDQQQPLFGTGQLTPAPAAIEPAEETAGEPGKIQLQVIDNNGGGAPLGLRTCSWIVDDEGIEMRQGSKAKPRIVILAERNTAAGQPFQISMLSKMDHCVRAEGLANPEIESEIFGRRR